MQDILQRLREAGRQRAVLLEQLAMWGEVQAQGIDPDDVQSFGFDPSLLTLDQKRAYREAVRLGKADPVTGERECRSDPLHPYTGKRLPNGHYRARVYNYVTLKDGRRITLSPLVKAPPCLDD